MAMAPAAFFNTAFPSVHDQTPGRQLLELFGFTLPPGAGPGANPHDAAPLDPEGPLSRRRRRSASPPPPNCCWLHWDGSPSWGLLRALRVAAAAPDELRARGHLVWEGRAAAGDGDAAPAAWIREAAAAQLAAMEMSREEDGRRLGGHAGVDEGPGAQCLRAAVEWRLGHKAVLARACRLGLPPSV
jgi:hypothetical protein